MVSRKSQKTKPLEFSGLQTYSLHGRQSMVSVDDFGRPLLPGSSIRELIDSLPAQLLGRDFPELVRRLAAIHRAERPILVGMGAHVIKVGLNPILIDLMERSIISGLALNGACIIHDAEIAMAGSTSEDVAAVLGDGAFGAARETGEVINAAINQGAEQGLGMGEAVGRYLLEQKFTYNHLSLVAAAVRLGVPVTVHVAVGTDITHIHPSASGAAIGQTSYQDFRLFAAQVAELRAGAYLNIGSAVLLPEIFLKALTVARNLGHQVDDIVTANFDFMKQYRSLTNVVNRPTAGSGRGFHVTGHHELMIPLLAACLLDELADDSC
ncbi:MAG: hypothetical protein H8E79_08280 [Desulfobulbaceae bacterium]|uniref:Uncharacterized protein n=1 Tax=Candidatus Desulfatifera sulfidica TaxID=2841691 RepID=A0A8J6NAE6_9BACT|nr:hypothetical protein [Candidatus Desulfatifera sulfidica]